MASGLLVATDKMTTTYTPVPTERCGELPARRVLRLMSEAARSVEGCRKELGKHTRAVAQVSVECRQRTVSEWRQPHSSSDGWFPGVPHQHTPALRYASCCNSTFSDNSLPSPLHRAYRHYLCWPRMLKTSRTDGYLACAMHRRDMVSSSPLRRHSVVLA